MDSTSPLWIPHQDRLENSRAFSFVESIKSLEGANKIKNFHELYDWSIRYPEEFWNACWEFFGIKGIKNSPPIISQKNSMRDARWFPHATLNFAENLLSQKGGHRAVTFYGEEKVVRTLSWDELWSEVARVNAYLIRCGIKDGDVVAGILPNMPEAIIGMLATAALGATWTSCSPDFGAPGVIDRFGQTEPKVLISADGYYYKGSIFALNDKVNKIVSSIPSVKHLLIARYTESPLPETSAEQNIWETLPLATQPLTFVQVPFSHPLYIMYSSGTTGKPKCIVHSVGGTLIEHLKEHILHVELKKEDTITYQTTCGWMMWNWLVSALAVGAHIVLYDGYPFARGGNIFFDLIDSEKISVYGTNAKYIASLEKEDVRPQKTHSLASLHTILSTGSPLLPESFDYVYRDIKKDICLSSISGGTDIIGCFALGTPTLPVYRGELQTRSLGLKVEVWDDSGAPLIDTQGELVCTAPFPSQPVGFWSDASKEKYTAAYFSRFPNVWHHGDYVSLTSRGGMIFYGRSDTVLNPGGIRIGTAEIYRQVEAFPEIQESIVVGQDWESDVRIVLFVKMVGDQNLTDDLKKKIQSHIKKHASPFHVPKIILEVQDIPRTRSGKITETAVRDVIHGRPVKNTEALSNPEALQYFKDRVELSSKAP